MNLKIKFYLFLCSISDCFREIKGYENTKSLYPEDD